MYSATKAAVIYFSYGLRNQLKKKKISVSCLTPGPVFTKPQIKAVTKEKLGWLWNANGSTTKKSGRNCGKKNVKKEDDYHTWNVDQNFCNIIRILPRRWMTGIYGGLGD